MPLMKYLLIARSLLMKKSLSQRIDSWTRPKRTFSLDRSPSKRNERSFLAVQSVADCLLQMVSSDDKTDRVAPALFPGHPLNRSSPPFYHRNAFETKAKNDFHSSLLKCRVR
ncbi:hypothetical protein TNIN_297771 [Trichonephila inaurata madagascariensis]|uniref:Uncharacterized protein n=1 Tax=Trichonephila inaurata madagascariensis TaxID=2747483 RepID=A0A8X6XRK0_9ARAC|nr:hypothetical protein TNIN_297771 [Trichonephila inaurata madagascariensis]